ncbi:MAG: hypothetical protein ACI35R_18470 [Bacillus sp. (in: firmicutes)]
MKSSRGYILLDTLGALSIVLFVCMTLLPIFLKLENDRGDLLKETKAHHLLYENLQRYSVQQEFASTEIGPMSSSGFEINIQPFERNGLYMEGCVTYRNSQKKQITICDVVKARTGFYAD